MEIDENNSNNEVEENPLGIERTVSADETENEQNISIIKKKEVTLDNKRKLEDYDDEGSLCPICFDNWTTSGEHRLCSLKCGHLFGWNCLDRWLTFHNKKACPTCKLKANKNDIRYIYAKRVLALDTTELNALKEQIQILNEEKNRLNIELAKRICNEESLKQDLNKYKDEIRNLNIKLEYVTSSNVFKTSQGNTYPQTSSIKLYMDKSLEICKDGGCRVLDSKIDMDVILSSAKSPMNLFAEGHGVRKINISNYKPTAYIQLHSKPIRDIRFHAHNSCLLSVSLDKTIKITDITNNYSIASYSFTNPLWSCCWDVDNPNILYAGEQQGTVLKFDTRKFSDPLALLSVPGDSSPVVSVASIGTDVENNFPVGGIICCKLNSVWVFRKKEDEYHQTVLPIDGPFVSMSFHNTKKQILISARPNIRTPYTRHLLCYIENDKNESDLKCNIIHSFNGGSTQKLLSKSCLFSHNGDYVAAHQETSRSVNLWNANTGNIATTLPAFEPVLDICNINTDTCSYLACLTDKKLEFFKFTS